MTWALVYNGNRVNGEITPQFRGEFDFGLPLPLAHSSIWLRSAAGVANGDRNSTVANFYFGGFGNNYVDDKSIKRYREYSIRCPGFGIDQVSALSTSCARWPSGTCRRTSSSRSARPASTSPGCGRRCSPRVSGPIPATRRCASSTRAWAVRSTCSFSVLHRYDMTLSAGYAVGFQGSQRVGSEWMISLKIM